VRFVVQPQREEYARPHMAPRVPLTQTWYIPYENGTLERKTWRGGGERVRSCERQGDTP